MQTTNDTSADVGSMFKDELATIANDLLDTFYGAHPTANAFGADYEGPGQTPDGTYYLGREDGADGAEDTDLGFDYFYRKFRDPENPRQDSYEYVNGKYGWMDDNALVEETPLLRQVFESAVEDDFLDESALDRFDTAVDLLADDLQSVRDQYDLSDLARLFRDHDIDTLRTLLAHGDEEGRVVWQLCFSKDEDGEHIENPIELPVLSERDQFMLVRTDRYYYDDQSGEGKHYTYGAVVGYDDTPQRFFVHRLDSDPDLRDPETEWTPSLVKEKMGFDYNLEEVDSDDLPYLSVTRVQGDLAVVRHDYEAALDDYRRSLIESKKRAVLREHAEAFLEANPEYDEAASLYLSAYGRISVRADSTDEIKALQDDLGITEPTVRREQENREYARLTAKRRVEIVEDLVADRVVEWADDHTDVDQRTLKAESATEAIEAFEDTQAQINDVLGNHTIIMANATVHPDRTFGDESTLEAFVVPEEAPTFVIHDEHEDKKLALQPGVYELRFLQGHEDEWWQDN